METRHLTRQFNEKHYLHSTKHNAFRWYSYCDYEQHTCTQCYWDISWAEYVIICYFKQQIFRNNTWIQNNYIINGNYCQYIFPQVTVNAVTSAWTHFIPFQNRSLWEPECLVEQRVGVSDFFGTTPLSDLIHPPSSVVSSLLRAQPVRPCDQYWPKFQSP